MTPEQFADWQDEQPDWISNETAVLAACIKDIADFISYDIGPSIQARENGDALWYVLTDENADGVLVLMCTPHAVFAETTIGTDDVEYAMLVKPLQYLEHLQNMGLRRLTDDELENFSEGYF